MRNGDRLDLRGWKCIESMTMNSEMKAYFSDESSPVGSFRKMEAIVEQAQWVVFRPPSN